MFLPCCLSFRNGPLMKGLQMFYKSRLMKFCIPHKASSMHYVCRALWSSRHHMQGQLIPITSSVSRYFIKISRMEVPQVDFGERKCPAGASEGKGRKKGSLSLSRFFSL